MNAPQQQPLAEVFGFPINNTTSRATRLRKNNLCPFHNRVPNCTKDKAKNPLGVCSIYHKDDPVITCPVRFREDWIVVEEAAKFFFAPTDQWTTLTEVRLKDKLGNSAGNIDVVLVSYDDSGQITDFASLEIQAVYISGNLRDPFQAYQQSPSPEFAWQRGYNYPSPDYLSSSRKRLIPQLLYKGGILRSWGKKQAVALQRSFFQTLPSLPTVSENQAEMAWFLYDLVYHQSEERFKLTLADTIYTQFFPALQQITTPQPDEVGNFLAVLQRKLDEKLENPPDAPILTDFTPE